MMYSSSSRDIPYLAYLELQKKSYFLQQLITGKRSKLDQKKSTIAPLKSNQPPLEPVYTSRTHNLSW